MLKFIKNLFINEKCTECGKSFSRLEWGGRNHITNKGVSYIHPIDYIMTINCKTNEEKRNAISKLENIDIKMRNLHKEMGGEFCKDHYKGCPV